MKKDNKQNENLTPEQEEYLRYHYWYKQQEEQSLWEQEHSKQHQLHHQWQLDYLEVLQQEKQEDDE